MWAQKLESFDKVGTRQIYIFGMRSILVVIPVLTALSNCWSSKFYSFQEQDNMAKANTAGKISQIHQQSKFSPQDDNMTRCSVYYRQVGITLIWLIDWTVSQMWAMDDIFNFWTFITWMFWTFIYHPIWSPVRRAIESEVDFKMTTKWTLQKTWTLWTH